MSHLISFPVAGVLGLSATEHGIVIAMIVIPVGLIIVLAGMYFRFRQEKLWHETARIALEKGQPVPTMPGEEPRPDRSRDLAHDFRAGLILVGTGIGLRYIVGPGIAAIVGFIGAALLVYAACAALFRRKNSPKDPTSRS